jgi:hypothetical protein
MTSYRANPQLVLDLQNSQIECKGGQEPIAYTTYITNQPGIYVTEFITKASPGNFNAVGLGDFLNPQTSLAYTVAYSAGGTVYVNGLGVGPITPQPWDDGPHRITLAVDWQNALFWYSLDQTLWNNDVFADPAAATGGFDFSSVGLSQFCFASQFTNTDDIVTISTYITRPVTASIEVPFRIPFSIVYSDNDRAYVQIVNDAYAREIVLFENAQQLTLIQPVPYIFEYQFLEGKTYQLIWQNNPDYASDIFAITPPTITLNILSAANSSITFQFKDGIVPDTDYNLTLDGITYATYSSTGTYTIDYNLPPGSIWNVQINRTDTLVNYYISPVIQVTIEQNLALTGLTDTSVQLVLNPTSTCLGTTFFLYQNGVAVQSAANPGGPVSITRSGLLPNHSYTFYYTTDVFEISSPLYITTPSVPPTQKLNFSTTWFFSP